MMELKIRLANKKDSEEILKLLNSDSNLRDDDELEYSIGGVRELLIYPHKIFVFEENSKIIGLVTWTFYDYLKKIYLYHLIVKKEYRRKNIDSKILNRIENSGKKNGFKIIFYYVEKENKNMIFLSKNRKYVKERNFYHFQKN